MNEWNVRKRHDDRRRNAHQFLRYETLYFHICGSKVAAPLHFLFKMSPRRRISLHNSGMTRSLLSWSGTKFQVSNLNMRYA
jgi:hypothetical protein